MHSLIIIIFVPSRECFILQGFRLKMFYRTSLSWNISRIYNVKYVWQKCGLTGRAYTFADIQKLSYRFANSLRKAGFTKGDIIAVVMPNCPEYAIAVLGALEAELSLTFLNHGYTDGNYIFYIISILVCCNIVRKYLLLLVINLLRYCYKEHWQLIKLLI